MLGDIQNRILPMVTLIGSVWVWWGQSASLSLTTTPAEEMALGLRLWLAPLRLLRVPVDEIALTLLLSLRFMALVTEVVLATIWGFTCYLRS